MSYNTLNDLKALSADIPDNSDEDALDEIIARKGLPRGTRRITGGDYVQARLAATYGMKVAA